MKGRRRITPSKHLMTIVYGLLRLDLNALEIFDHSDFHFNIFSVVPTLTESDIKTFYSPPVRNCRRCRCRKVKIFPRTAQENITDTTGNCHTRFRTQDCTSYLIKCYNDKYPAV